MFRLSNGLLLLEGIGCLNSHFGVFGYQNDTGVSTESQTAQISLAEGSLIDSAILSFLKYGDNTVPLYIAGDWEQGIEQATMGRKTTGVIHDLQGRRLASPPDKGVYILDGKKYVK